MNNSESLKRINNYTTCNRCGCMLETVEQAVVHSVQCWCQPHDYQPQEHPLLAAIKAAHFILTKKQAFLTTSISSLPTSATSHAVDDEAPKTALLSSNNDDNDEPIDLAIAKVGNTTQFPTTTKSKLVICKQAVDFRTLSAVKRKATVATATTTEPAIKDEACGTSSIGKHQELLQSPGGINNGSSNAHNRKHVCEFCQKSFQQKRTLVAHRRIHTGEKPYKCPICEATFTQATHRNGHVKTHDPNFRPYSCTICGRCFARKYSLTMHSYIHQGIFPFKCAFCEKKFRQAADMRKHEQRHVTHFSLLCRKCHLKFPSKAALERHMPICSRDVSQQQQT